MSRGNSHGQATAELAILLPLFVLILLGCLDLGRVFSVWLTLSNATREGARLAASSPADSTKIIERTRVDIAEQGLPAGQVAIKVEPTNAAQRVGGQPVTVTASYSMQLATTYLFGAKPVVIAARTSMVVLPGGN